MAFYMLSTTLAPTGHRSYKDVLVETKKVQCWTENNTLAKKLQKKKLQGTERSTGIICHVTELPTLNFTFL